MDVDLGEISFHWNNVGVFLIGGMMLSRNSKHGLDWAFSGMQQVAGCVSAPGAWLRVTGRGD